MTNEQKLREALQAFEKAGTGFDICPTRRLPQSEDARRVDEWWLRYFMEADLAVRVRARQALATTEPEFNQEPFIGDPVLVVEREPDYWDRGHFHEGTKPDIKCTKIWGVPIGTKLYTEDQMKSYGEQCWKAGYDLGKSAKNL